MWALHVEQDGDGPRHCSGWTELSVATVPTARLAQPGVIAQNTFQSASCVVIWLTDGGISAEKGDALRSFVALLLPVLQHTPAALGFSARALALLGLEGLERCPEFLEKRSSETKEVLLPATGGDVIIWIKAGNADSCSRAWRSALEPLETWISHFDETHCQAFGGKDLTGFIDGTGNPDQSLRPLVEAAVQPKGGSVLYAGRFVHNLQAFRAMSKDCQSAIVGRRIDAVCPAKGLDGRTENPRYLTPDLRGHILRSWGEMYRQAMPYRKGGAKAAEAGKDEGLMFVAFAANHDEVESALRRMSGEFTHMSTVGNDSGHDNIFRISRAASSSYFYVPSLAELQGVSGQVCSAPCTLPLFVPEEGIEGQLRGSCQSARCPNCADHSTFMVPPGSDLARCLLCRRIFRCEGMGLHTPKM